MSNYFIISSYPDDQEYATIEKCDTKEQLLEKIEEESKREDTNFFSRNPDLYFRRWPEGVLIIKGEVVVPKPIKPIIEKFDIA